MNKYLVIGGLFFLMSRSACAAQPFCALRIRVLGPDGSPVETTVALRDETGRERQTARTDEHGTADFCDVGFGLFDVVVGANVCGQVVVKYLYTIWPQTREVKVTYRDCHANVPRSGCDVILRVQSPDGKPIEDMSFTGTGMPRGSATDRYGRLMTFLLWGKRLDGELSRPSYESERVSIQCQRGSKHQIEEVVHLRPTGNQ